MRLGLLISLALAVPVLATGLSATAAAGPTGPTQAAPRACTADDLSGTETGVPLKLMDPAKDLFPDLGTIVTRLTSGHRYAAVVDESLATRESSATRGSSVPVEGSVHVTGPSGLALTRKTKSGTVYYVFKAPAPGRLRFDVTWQQDSEATPTSADEICAAAAGLETPVVAPKLVRGVARFTEGYRFSLRVVNQSPPDPRPVTAILRVRRGVAVPPPASGGAAERRGFYPLGPLSPNVIYYAAWKLHFGIDTDTNGAVVRVDPDGNFPRGSLLRFGFSVELRQGGRRVGGMRSGVVCRRVQFVGHSEPRCTHPGFAPRP